MLGSEPGSIGFWLDAWLARARVRVRLRVRVTARVRFRVRVRVSVTVRVRLRLRVRVKSRARGGLLPTTSHSIFYNTVGQIAIFSHCQP